jgi:hypothetical protein
MVDVTGTRSGSLFAEKRLPRRNPLFKRRTAPELQAARVLCHQLRNKRTRLDKERLVHLICLNLKAILRHRSQP